MRIEILDKAERDLKEGFQFYEQHYAGLGQYFLDSLFSDIDSLQIFAGIHPQYWGYYRLLSKRFPFAVYYRIEIHIVKIYAILDCRRNPSWAYRRLSAD